ncbi:MAG: signal recognition particle protein [Gammaproteobacteria bacterium]|nr:signal recognition particle protein [Gammaproteobacteria bacterium]
MFDNLSDRLGQVLRTLRGQGRLTEDNIKDALREVRMSLLEADVALPVIRDLINRIKEKAAGQQVLHSLTPGQMLIKVVRDELTQIMGEPFADLNFQVTPPMVILMAGLQGAGKTTSAGKLARWIHDKHKRSVLLASTDIYRPAAIKQLETLAGEVGATFFPSSTDQDPVAIASAAIQHARRHYLDVVIIDTAGRLHVDAAMMDEIKRLHQATSPTETLFVVDSMTGQDAANTAKAFGDALPLTGVILTKTDGDARGGAALSVRHITGKPIKFLGTGEKSPALEPFHPERVASRILGMGDILSLVEEAEGKIDRAQVEKLASKLKKGKGFDLGDFRDQLQQMRRMGGVSSMLDKLPGAGKLPAHALQQVDDRQFIRMEAIINSMTPGERHNPDLIKASRKRRIAAGAGVQVQDVNRMLKQFDQMQRMMKKFSKGGLAKMMRGLKGSLPF